VRREPLAANWVGLIRDPRSPRPAREHLVCEADDLPVTVNALRKWRGRREALGPPGRGRSSSCGPDGPRRCAPRCSDPCGSARPRT
jgi:hypothetical protein